MRRPLSRSFAAALVAVALCSAVSAADLDKTIGGILSRPELARGMHGCVVKLLDGSKELYSYNPDTLLMPASNMKLYTSAAALELLGADFQYKTRLLSSGKLTGDGTLEGDIAIVGSGNPILDTEDLDALVAQAAKNGLKAVHGSVVADTANFSRTPYGSGWAWDYLSDYYAAPAGGLNYHKNVCDVTVEPSATAGMPGMVTVGPVDGYLRVRNETKTGDSGSQENLDRWRELSARVVTVSGSVPKGQEAATFTVAVYDPADYAAAALKQQLEKAGIAVSGGVRTGSAGQSAELLGEVASEPMASIVRRLNKWSDNLIAECLLRTIGSAKRDEGSIWAGRAAAYDLFEKAGLARAGLNMSDGSGLSRMDLITAGNTVRLLEYMHKSKNSQAYIDSLPIAGKDGTLSRRMAATAAAGNVRAKTGYIGNVASLSGYVTTAAGQQLAFSMIFNHQLAGVGPCQRAMDDICGYLAGLQEKL